MLKKILSVSGRSGLFKLISQGKNMYIVESITDGKRIPTYPRDKVVSLGDIAIYTSDKEVPLSKILHTIKEKENGKKVSLPSVQPEALKEYFAEILPTFDRERVYPSDIKKLFNWYNLLVDANMTDFLTEETKEKEAEEEETKEEAEAKTEEKAEAKTVEETESPKS